MAESSPEDERFDFDDNDWQAILHDAAFNLAQLTTFVPANEESGIQFQYTYPPAPALPIYAEFDLEMPPQDFDLSPSNDQDHLPAMEYTGIDPILLLQVPNDIPVQADLMPLTIVQSSWDQQEIEALSTSQFHPAPLDNATPSESSITLGPLL